MPVAGSSKGKPMAEFQQERFDRTKFITLDELSERWKKSKKQIRAWVHSGRLPLPMRFTVRDWIWKCEFIEQIENQMSVPPKAATETEKETVHVDD
jgi:hypothetical protein